MEVCTWIDHHAGRLIGARIETTDPVSGERHTEEPVFRAVEAHHDGLTLKLELPGYTSNGLAVTRTIDLILNRRTRSGATSTEQRDMTAFDILAIDAGDTRVELLART